MKYLKDIQIKINKETQLKKQWQDISNKIKELEQLEQYGTMLYKTTNTLKNK